MFLNCLINVYIPPEATFNLSIFNIKVSSLIDSRSHRLTYAGGIEHTHDTPIAALEYIPQFNLH